MLLTIAIPTFNRAETLSKNLLHLDTICSKLKCKDEVEILISDNGSEEYQKSFLKEFILKFGVRYYFQDKNIGFESNCLFLLDQANGEYIMLLGDDDFLSLKYLERVLYYCRNKMINAIIPNYYNIDENGNFFKGLRDPETEDYLCEGMKALKLVVKAHQMSGIVFKSEGVKESYIINVKSNVYPQLYFLGYNILKGKVVHITKYPLKVTTTNKKNFSYDFDYLFGDIARSIDGLTFSGSKEKKELEKYIAKFFCIRFCNKNTLMNPFYYIYIVKSKYNISSQFQKIIIKEFLSGYIRFIIKFLK